MDISSLFLWGLLLQKKAEQKLYVCRLLLKDKAGQF